MFFYLFPKQRMEIMSFVISRDKIWLKNKKYFPPLEKVSMAIYGSEKNITNAELIKTQHSSGTISIGFWEERKIFLE